jgi:hypothetical protein
MATILYGYTQRYGAAALWAHYIIPYSVNIDLITMMFVTLTVRDSAWESLGSDAHLPASL